MKTRPMISVLMPVYNVEKYVRQAIESILSQTYTDFELIIVNDGSTDGTLDIINSFQDDRIKIYNQTNHGESIIRNRLIKLAKGKYLAWLDGDDIAYPFRFEKQINFLEKHQDFIMMGSSAIIIDEFGKFKSIMFTLTKDEEIKWQMLFNNSFANSSVVFRRDVVVNQNLKFADYKTGTDFRFWIELIKFGKSKNILTPLIAYRIHDNQITKQYEKERKINKHRTLIDNLKKFEPSITSNDIDVLNKWYWGIKTDIGESDLHTFKKLANIMLNANSKNYYDFTKMFRVFYDKLILKNLLLLKINDILPILKILIAVDRVGILLMPFRFIIIPFKILWRIIRKAFSLISFCFLFIMYKKRDVF